MRRWSLPDINTDDPLIISTVNLVIILIWWFGGILGYVDLTGGSGISDLGKIYAVNWAWFIFSSCLFIAVCLRLIYKRKLLVSHESLVCSYYGYTLVSLGLLLYLFVSAGGGILLLIVGSWFVQYGRVLRKRT